MELEQITSLEQYESTINNNQNLPVVMVFSAQWCGPCKQYKPTLQTLNDTIKNAIFVSVDIEDEFAESIIKKHAIRGVPSTHFYVNNGLHCSKVGVLTKITLISILTEMNTIKESSK